MLTFLGFLVFAPLVFFLTVIILFQIGKKMFNPSLHRDWFGLFEKLPHGSFDGEGNIFIKNIRNAKYNPNYEYECKVEYLNKKYNVHDIEKVWLFVNPYAPLQSHVILSFQFGPDHYARNFLTISYELRKTDPQDFSASSLIFKNYEGHYIFAPEEDTIYVRSNVRHVYEETHFYMFPLNIQREIARKIFLDLVNEANVYTHKAFFYGVYKRSCVSEIFKHFKKYGIVQYSTNFPLSNVLSFVYNSKIVSGSENLDFESFKKKYYITGKTKGLEANEDFAFELRKRLMV